MEFTFETTYNQKALTAMAKGLRKTLRKKRSRRSHIFGWIIVILSILLMVSVDDGLVFSFRNVVTWVAIIAIAAVTVFEDALNGFIAGKRMLRGTVQSTAVFHDKSSIGGGTVEEFRAFIAEKTGKEVRKIK